MPRRVDMFSVFEALQRLGPSTPLELSFYFGQGQAGAARVEHLLRGALKPSVFWLNGKAHIRPAEPPEDDGRPPAEDPWAALEDEGFDDP